MTETLGVYPQILNYYNYNVMCNYAFEEPEQVIQNGYTYEENGVLYCASGTQKGVYWYVYARNNPLSYTDPSGEFIQYIFGAIIGGFSGWQMGKAAGATGWKMFGYIMGGAGIGAATAGIGTAVTGAIGATASFAGAGVVAAATGGAVAGAASGLGFGVLNASMTGQWDAGAIFKGMGVGALTGLVQGGLSSYIGGTAGALVGGAASGAVGSALNGGKWSDVLISAAIGAGVSAGAYEISMGVGYARYKNSGGDWTYNQYRNVSVASQRSFARGQERGGWILDNGKVQMWPTGTSESINPTGMPPNAKASFHTHPNWGGNYIEMHGPGDIYNNNNFFRIDSYVIGRQNVYLQQYLHNPLLLYPNTNFNPYPYSYYPFWQWKW